MIYEMRTYTAMPGKLRALAKRFEDTTHQMFLKYGFRPLGYWTEGIGDNTKLHYILEWEDDKPTVMALREIEAGTVSTENINDLKVDIADLEQEFSEGLSAEDLSLIHI